MAHAAQTAFIFRVVRAFPDAFIGKTVLDCGCLDINGNNRIYFQDCKYIGVDVAPGKNVDVVSAIHKLAYLDESFDTVISTEMFEHDMYWKESFRNMVRMLKPGGLLVFTCAGIGRNVHGTKDIEPWDSPTSQIPSWENYYRNMADEDFKTVINFDNTFSQWEFSHNAKPIDLYFWGIKK